MASSHPVITSYFHASDLASWLSTAFLLTSTAFQPIFGRVSDIFGWRGPFLIAIIMFAAGTTWYAVCGFGAGGAMAIRAIINSDLVPLHIRASYQSILNLAFGIGVISRSRPGRFRSRCAGVEMGVCNSR
jgi:MFS family permease